MLFFAHLDSKKLRTREGDKSKYLENRRKGLACSF